MAITRTAWTDDDGTGTTGTIINNAEKTLLYNQIDASAAFVNQANTFDSLQTMAGLSITESYPLLELHSSVDPVNSRKIFLENWGQACRLSAYNDDRSVFQGGLSMSRTGALSSTSSYSEYGRTTPMGHWTIFSPVLNYPDFTPVIINAGYGSAYTVIGKTVIVSVTYSLGIVGAPTTLLLTIPGGFTCYSRATAALPYSGSAVGVGLAHTIENQPTISIMRDHAAAGVWPAGGGLLLSFTISIPVY